MIKPSIFLALFSIVVFCSPMQAQDQSSTVLWERSSAMAAVRSVDIDAAVYELGNLSELADANATLNRLEALENRSDWPLPAREAAIYRFTQSLAALPRGTVSPMVMRHLQNYQAGTMVAHEEHINAAVPLFNIRAAAAGVEHSWQRREFVFEGESLIQSDPQALLDAYINAANHNQRFAYIDVLRNAKLADVIAIQDSALQILAETPVLTTLVAAAVVRTTDLYAIQQWLSEAQGAGISSALVDIAGNLPVAEIADLLKFAVEQTPVANASMAIANWSPFVRYQTGVRDLLIDLLENPDLGSSAALALAHYSDIQTIWILKDAAYGDGVAARHAQMALDLNRDRLVEEGIL